jgi:hypothetical protein
VPMYLVAYSVFSVYFVMNPVGCPFLLIVEKVRPQSDQKFGIFPSGFVRHAFGPAPAARPHRVFVRDNPLNSRQFRIVLSRLPERSSIRNGWQQRSIISQPCSRFRLCGSEWLVIGAKDEGSERYIRGLTVGIALCDEFGSWGGTLVSGMPDGGSLEDGGRENIAL